MLVVGVSVGVEHRHRQRADVLQRVLVARLLGFAAGDGEFEEGHGVRDRSIAVLLQERRKPRAFALAPPPATAGGGWEGVPTVRADPKDTPPQPVRPASTARSEEHTSELQSLM